MNPIEVPHYRRLFKDVLSRRQAGNPRYSLRAFARDLSLSPAQLSQILSGKRGISVEKAKKAFTALDLSPQHMEICLLQVLHEHSRSLRAREEAAESLGEHLQELEQYRLSQDAFEAMAEWHHFAILQGMSLEDIPRSRRRTEVVRWISRKLGLTESVAEAAVDRLIRLDLIGQEKGRLSLCHDTVVTSDGVPSAALRSFHRQVLQRALLAIESQPLEERYFNTVMLPVRRDQVPLLRKQILLFQKRMMKRFGRAQEKDGQVIYAIAQQCFRISEEK